MSEQVQAWVDRARGQTFVLAIKRGRDRVEYSYVPTTDVEAITLHNAMGSFVNVTFDGGRITAVET